MANKLKIKKGDLVQVIAGARQSRGGDRGKQGKVLAVYPERNRVLAATTSVWYRTWYPRVPEAFGRKHSHAYDDVKDHLPQRTTDMSYLIYRQLLYPLGKWANVTAELRNGVAAAHSLPSRPWSFDWQDLQA